MSGSGSKIPEMAQADTPVAKKRAPGAPACAPAPPPQRPPVTLVAKMKSDRRASRHSPSTQHPLATASNAHPAIRMWIIYI
jgi:hypothetical protein